MYEPLTGERCWPSSMAEIGLLTPRRRDTLLVVLAVGLLLGPIWIPVFDLGEPTYRYERVRITVGGETGLAYANNTSHQVTTTPISDDIGCSVPDEIRICTLEQYAANNTVFAGFTSNPSYTPRSLGTERYRYVLLNGTAYATSYVPNRSVQTDQGLYRLELGLEAESLDDVLQEVSLNTTSQRTEIPPVIYQAATDGHGESHRRVEGLQTPIRVANGTYYRVYFAGGTEASPVGQFLGDVLPVGAPVVGLLALYVLSRRFEVSVTHRGTRSERWER